MTVANQTNRTSAVGTGSTGQEVPFSFPITATSDLTVYSRVTATGVETALAETTNYTVSISGDTGGTLTTVTAIETTEEIHLVRTTPFTQSLDLEQGGSYNAENIEDALDKNTKLAIDNKDNISRAIRAPATDAVALDLELPSSVDRASKNLGFDASGNVTTTDSSGNFSTTNAYWDDVIMKSPWHDIRAYGGVGDDSTNNDTAFSNAITDLPATGGTIIIPPGTYKITTPITFGDKRIHLLGIGSTEINNATGAIIKNYGDDDAILINPNSIVGRSIIENIDILDGLAAGVRTDGDGIHAERDDSPAGNISVTLRNVSTVEHTNGIYIARGVLCSIEHCIGDANDNHGFYFDSTASGTGNTIRASNCFARNNVADGFYMSGHWSCSFTECAADGNVNGFTLITDDSSNPAGISFIGCVTEDNTGDGILLTDGDSISAINIIGGVMFSNDSDGINTNDAIDVTIQSVRLESNGGYGISMNPDDVGAVVLINNNYTGNTSGEISAAAQIVSIDDSTQDVTTRASSIYIPSHAHFGMQGGPAEGGTLEVSGNGINVLGGRFSANAYSIVTNQDVVVCNQGRVVNNLIYEN